MLKILVGIPNWKALICNRSANSIADQVAKMAIPYVMYFYTRLPMHIQILYSRDLPVKEWWNWEFTRNDV